MLLTDAEAAIERALELTPQAALANYSLGLIRLPKGRNEEALAAAGRETHPIFGPLGLALTHHALGNAPESDAALHALVEKYAADAAYQVAPYIRIATGIDLALEWLARAYAQRDSGSRR